MASHHLGQMSMLVAQAQMPIASTPLAHSCQSPRVTAFDRHLPYPIHPFLRLDPQVGEAEEVERGASRVRMANAVRSIDAKVDEARLVGVELEPVPLKTLAQHVDDPLGIFENLESHHAVISVPHEDVVPFEARPHVQLEPFIQHMVQVDVCKQGETTPPCGVPSVVC